MRDHKQANITENVINVIKYTKTSAANYVSADKCRSLPTKV